MGGGVVYDVGAVASWGGVYRERGRGDFISVSFINLGVRRPHRARARPFREK
jgi:hypothetical protein